MSGAKDRPTGADTTGKAARRSPVIRLANAGNGVSGGPSRDSSPCQCDFHRDMTRDQAWASLS